MRALRAHLRGQREREEGEGSGGGSLCVSGEALRGAMAEARPSLRGVVIMHPSKAGRD